MAKQNLLYVPMERDEYLLGWGYLILQTLLLPPVLRVIFSFVWPDYTLAVFNLVFFALNFAAVIFLFRDFLVKSFQDLSGKIWPSIWKAAVAVFAAKIVTIVMNDFIFFYCPQYFYYTDTGPVLININDTAIADMASGYFVLYAIATVVLVPVAEELLHRGVVFGSIYPKSPVLAVIVSTLLFASIHMTGFVAMNDSVYFIILFLQYIPSALILCWLYASADTILAPILMHMAFNFLGVLSMR